MWRGLFSIITECMTRHSDFSELVWLNSRCDETDRDRPQHQDVYRSAFKKFDNLTMIHIYIWAHKLIRTWVTNNICLWVCNCALWFLAQSLGSINGCSTITSWTTVHTKSQWSKKKPSCTQIQTSTVHRCKGRKSRTDLSDPGYCIYYSHVGPQQNYSSAFVEPHKQKQTSLTNCTLLTY